nr:gustatory receptor 28a [Fopius arisanus]
MHSNKHLILLKLIYIGTTIMGLAPYSIKISPRTSTKSSFKCKIAQSKLGTAYNILLSILLVGGALIVTPRLIEWQYSNYSVLFIIVVALTTTGNIICIIVVIYYTLNQNQIIIIGNQLSDFDEQYESKFFNRSGDSRRLKKCGNWIKTFALIIMWCGVSCTSVIVPQSAACVASFFITAILSSVHMQYSSIVDNLKSKFECLNEVLPSVFRNSISNIESHQFIGDIPNHQLIAH